MQRGKWQEKETKSRATNRLQQSFDQVVDVLDRVSNTTITKPKLEDLYRYDKCLPLLNGVPNLVKGSHLYFFGSVIFYFSAVCTISIR